MKWYRGTEVAEILGVNHTSFNVMSHKEEPEEIVVLARILPSSISGR